MIWERSLSCTGNIKGIGNGFQMLDLADCVCNLNLQGFLGTLQLAVAVEVFFGVLLRSEGRVKGNGDFLIRYNSLAALKDLHPSSRP